MNLFEMYKEGGPYMHIILLLAVVMLSVVVIKLEQMIRRKRLDMKLLDLILLSGSVALAVGLLSQIIGITEALEAIRIAGDISPKLIMAGAIISFYGPIFGFFVFIFSMVFYFVLKEIIKTKR